MVQQTYRDAMLPYGSNRCRCPTCGLYFTGERAFDRHRIGRLPSRLGEANERRCLSVAQMIDRGMALTTSGHWATERMTPEQLARKSGKLA